MRHDYSLSSFPDEKTKAQKFQINFVPNSSVIELRAPSPDLLPPNPLLYYIMLPFSLHSFDVNITRPL